MGREVEILLLLTSYFSLPTFKKENYGKGFSKKKFWTGTTYITSA